MKYLVIILCIVVLAACGEGECQQVVDTTELGAHIRGYSGCVPVKIYVTAGKIDSVVPLQNSETPRFFSRAAECLKDSWNGLTLQEAIDADVDAVSGATKSSNALIENVRLGATELLNRQ